MYRVGTGYDIHRLTSGRRLVLGGVEIPFELGLLGHSDADVLLHAIIDALLGASGEADIGTHFPDTDSSYKQVSSLLLLEKTASIIKANGFSIVNIDSVVIAERPKLAEYIRLMKENISGALNVADILNMGIKATTNEGLGAVGRQEGIAAQAVVLLKKNTQ